MKVILCASEFADRVGAGYRKPELSLEGLGLFDRLTEPWLFHRRVCPSKLYVRRPVKVQSQNRLKRCTSVRNFLLGSVAERDSMQKINDWSVMVAQWTNAECLVNGESTQCRAF